MCYSNKEDITRDRVQVKYYMDGADTRERENMRKVGRRTDKENVVRLSAIDSAAPKHFESSVAKLPDKRKRTTSEALAEKEALAAFVVTGSPSVVKRPFEDYVEFVEYTYSYERMLHLTVHPLCVIHPVILFVIVRMNCRYFASKVQVDDAIAIFRFPRHSNVLSSQQCFL